MKELLFYQYLLPGSGDREQDTNEVNPDPFLFLRLSVIEELSCVTMTSNVTTVTCLVTYLSKYLGQIESKLNTFDIKKFQLLKELLK